MKLRSLLLGSAFLLAACGGSEEVACTSAYWDGTIGTCLPENWQVVAREELTERGVPTEVVVAFQSNAPAAGQFPTITVTREALAQEIEAAEYSDASVESVTSLPGYREIDLRDVEIDGATVALHIFAAQPREDEPESRFFQVSSMKANIGYTFTAATPLAIDDALEEQIMLVLENATFEAPAEGGEAS